MVNVPTEIKGVFDKQSIIPMATADVSSLPDVILVGMWYWANDETLVVADNYLNKTRRNLEENPRVAFNGWADGKNYQLKGRVHFETSGSLFEEIRKRRLVVNASILVGQQ